MSARSWRASSFFAPESRFPDEGIETRMDHLRTEALSASGEPIPRRGD